MTLHADAARRRCLSYDVLTTIPAKILDTRDPEHSSREKDAHLVHDALLLKFSAAMPCLRSKQVRDASIHGAAANVFRGQLNAAGAITVPEWAAEELRRDPAAEFWQVRFSRVETGGSAIHTLLPRDVVPLLDEYLMLTRYAPELAAAPDFVDVVGEFERKVGLSLNEFEAMVFAVHSRFGADMSNRVVTNPALLPLKREDFAQTALLPEKVDAFLKFVSISPEDLKTEILQSNAGANDATPFRKYPMVQHVDPHTNPAPEAHLMIDNLTFLERAQTGPYWVANEDHSGNLRTFWGAVFERYVNDLLSRACSGTASRFFPDPRQQGKPSVQICDGIIAAGNAAVLMEYKANMFRADSKYSGDRFGLLKEIEKKWVRNQKGSKKGVEQLAAAVKRLFDGKDPQSIFPGVDWTKIEHVHVCLVTLDTLGETIGMSALLNTYLVEGLDFAQYPQGFICPLHCVDIASLERAAAYFDSISLPELLSRRLQLTTDFSASLSVVNLTIPRLNPWIESEWEAIGRQIVPIIFPGTDMDQFFAGVRESYEGISKTLSVEEKSA